MYTWTSNESKKHIGTTVFMLRVCRLDTKLVRMCPSWTTRRALMVREPREEPVICAVLVVDLECHEETSAERDRGKDRAATEDGYADADALFSLLHLYSHPTYTRAYHQTEASLKVGTMLGRVVRKSRALTEQYTHLSAAIDPRSEEPWEGRSIGDRSGRSRRPL